VSYKPFAPSLLKDAPREASSQLASWRLGGIAVLRIAFGCVWAIDAWFKWQPGFADDFTSYLTKALDGQPPAVATWINFWIHVVSVNPHLFAFLVSVGETGIALGLLFGALSNLTCLVGILLSVSIWSTAQGFGGPYGPGSTDIGVSIIYVLVFTGLFLSNAGLTFGVDRYLASALGSWSFLASGSIKQQRKQFIHPAPVPMGFPQMVAYRAVNRQPAEQLRRLRAVDDMLYQDGPQPVANGAAASNSRLETIKGQRLSRM
jgi:thiosulfate dehydrogenase (quinone) large subunit